MEYVSFEEEPTIVPVNTPAPQRDSLLSRLVISTGLAKNVPEAEGVLLAVAIAGFVFSALLVVWVNLPPQNPTQAQIQAFRARIKTEHH